jgi:hypothetical protein
MEREMKDEEYKMKNFSFCIFHSSSFFSAPTSCPAGREMKHEG